MWLFVFYVPILIGNIWIQLFVLLQVIGQIQLFNLGRAVTEIQDFFFIIKSFLTTVFIFISTTFPPICLLQASWGVCRTREPSRNFELRPLLNPRGSPFLIPFAIIGYKCFLDMELFQNVFFNMGLFQISLIWDCSIILSLNCLEKKLCL